MSKDTTVFISFRWTDTFGAAIHLHDMLTHCLSDGSCYLDFYRPYGTDMEWDVGHHLKSAKVVLVLIGPGWRWATDKKGTYRLLDPKDPVRKELLSALELSALEQHKKIIMPVPIGPVDWKEVCEWLEDFVRPLSGLARFKAYPAPDANSLHGTLRAISEAANLALLETSYLSEAGLDESVFRKALALKFPVPLRDSAAIAKTPFVGIGHFKESDASLFFGRASEILALCQMLEEYPLVLLYGQSGVGKSSLLRAGIRPRLRGTNLYVRRDKSTGYDKQIRELLNERQNNVIILDQIDEIYTDRSKDWKSEEADFCDAIAAARRESPSLKFVLSFRSEYYARIRDSLKERGVVLTSNQGLHLRWNCPVDRRK